MGCVSAPRREIYEPYSQTSLPFVAVAVRTDRDPGSLAGDLRRAVAQFDPEVPVAALATMEEHLTRAYGSLRFLSILTLVFGALARLPDCFSSPRRPIRACMRVPVLVLPGAGALALRTLARRAARTDAAVALRSE
ncbi:MAG: hypothetical protein ACM4AI_17055 [Acidobacteriota bacterium]